MKIEYTSDDFNAEIEVERATVAAGLMRLRLAGEGETAEHVNVFTDVMRCFTYPSLVASAPHGKLTVNGAEADWPPSWEDFLQFPDEFVYQWLEAAEKANPHFFELPEIDEKKASNVLTE